MERCIWVVTAGMTSVGKCRVLMIYRTSDNQTRVGTLVWGRNVRGNYI